MCKCVLCVGTRPVCVEGLGILHLCQLLNQQILFTIELFVNGEYFIHPCELLQDNKLVPCRINAYHCQFDIANVNFSSSYSFQCLTFKDNLIIRTGNFYFNSDSLPPCSGNVLIISISICARVEKGV